MKPGEIYMADTAFGTRPVLIVSREELNRGEYIVGVLRTSQRFEERSQTANCVAFRAGEHCLTKDSVAQAEAITFVPKRELHPGAVSVIGDEILCGMLSKPSGTSWTRIVNQTDGGPGMVSRTGSSVERAAAGLTCCWHLDYPAEQVRSNPEAGHAGA